tara:strand:+ start:28 stop:168 length:141 start_codon:yes stop_codon:yes gene_type:complete
MKKFRPYNSLKQDLTIEEIKELPDEFLEEKVVLGLIDNVEKGRVFS